MNVTRKQFLATLAALATTPAAVRAADMAPVRVGYTTGGALTKFFTALERGLFEAQGLKVKPIGFQSGSSMATAFKAGEIDIGQTGVPGLISGINTGIPVQAVYLDYDEAPGDWLVAAPGTNIETIKDLAGKKVGTFVGTNVWVELTLLLEKHGIKDQVRIVNIRPPAWVPSLRNKDVDAVIAWPTQAQQLGAIGKVIARGDEVAPDPIYWIGNVDFVAQQQASLASWIRGMDAAGAWVKAHTAEAADYVAKRTGVEVPIALQAITTVTDISLQEQLSPESRYSMVDGRGFEAILKKYGDVLRAGNIFPNVPKDFGPYINASALKSAQRQR